MKKNNAKKIDWIYPFNIVISSDINIRILSMIDKLGKISKEELGGVAFVPMRGKAGWK